MPSPHLEPLFAWIDSQREAAIADLQRYCRQPSIAAQGVGMEEMAAIVAADLRDLGADTTLVPTAGHPVAVGRLDGDSPRRVMIYNHYDVQPPEPLEEWRTPPFEAAIEDGVLYARGVADNKGNVVARMWAARAWLAVRGSLPCGVTFVFEGEEEVGSPHLAEFAAANRQLLEADACLWEAGYRDPNGAMVLYAGVKGMLYVELRSRTVAYDLHSGNANLAPNAAWSLVRALNSLRDEQGRVLIPGFYDDVRRPTERELELVRRSPMDVEGTRQLWGVDRLLGPSQDAVDLTVQSLFEPTCNIAGIWGGYSGPGTKTVLPATAGAKIDFRLVPDQDPERILASLQSYLADKGFSEVEVVAFEGTEWPAQSPVETPLMEAQARAARTVYGLEPRIVPRLAGTGPMEQLCQRYGLPAVGGAGVGNANSRVHAPNENVRLEDFVLSIKHVAAMLEEYASLEDA
ncbi:MAG: M20/M25/M40 family metallo-hydrolase [Chloroflexota bacterium]|nr:M20/M25/M40 family metallo-hydrolase [Chloroflexota bacterium]MDQ5865384.1 M20/M25/M40 family metallo-hydrolase [Chloroflexota bacterium]